MIFRKWGGGLEAVWNFSKRSSIWGSTVPCKSYFCFWCTSWKTKAMGGSIFFWLYSNIIPVLFHDTHIPGGSHFSFLFFDTQSSCSANPRWPSNSWNRLSAALTADINGRQLWQLIQAVNSFEVSTCLKSSLYTTQDKDQTWNWQNEMISFLGPWYCKILPFTGGDLPRSVPFRTVHNAPAVN